MGEALLARLDQFGAGVIGVAIDTRRFGQRLVEGDCAGLPDNRHALARAQSYVRNRMARDASVGGHAPHRAVASEAIGREFRMGRH